MLFKKSPEKFWNLIANSYAASPIADKTGYESKIEKIKTYLKHDDLVLDIGCGTATQCGDIADHVKQVTGIDISSKLLKIAEQRMAQRKIENVKLIQTSVFDEQFLPNSFDVVLAFYVLHLIEDIEAMLDRIHSLLKPGGIFISESACLGGKNPVATKSLRFVGQLGFVPLINLLTTEQLEFTLDKCGFTLLEKHIFGQSKNEYTLFAKKPI